MRKIISNTTEYWILDGAECHGAGSDRYKYVIGSVDQYEIELWLDGYTLAEKE